MVIHYSWLVATQIFLGFSPLFGEDSHFDSYFSNGLKPPTSIASIAFVSTSLLLCWDINMIFLQDLQSQRHGAIWCETWCGSVGVFGLVMSRQMAPKNCKAMLPPSRSQKEAGQEWIEVESEMMNH